MARTHYSTFVARKGATLNCDKGHPIAKGERYQWVKPRSAWRRMVRCMAHPFRPSEVTTSKMSGVYAAQESAQDELNALTGQPGDVGDLQSILESAADSIEEVAEEYREAKEASPTGYVFGEDLEERADEITAAADELRSWSPDEDEPDYDQCENVAHEAAGDEPEYLERGSDDCESCVEIRTAWWDETVDAAVQAVSDLSV